MGGAGADKPAAAALNLHQAVMRSDTAALERLLSQGACINKPNNAGLTPLMLAIERVRPDAQAFLEQRGPAHLYAGFGDERVAEVAGRPVYGYSGPAERLQVLELELRHPEQRQASLRRLLSYTGGTVEQVSRTVEAHALEQQPGSEAEALDERAGGTSLQCRKLKGRKADRVRFEGTGVPEGLDMVDTQELFDEMECWADPKKAAAAAAALAKEGDKPRRHSVTCTFGDSTARLPERGLPVSHSPVSSVWRDTAVPRETESFAAGWFPEMDGGVDEDPLTAPASRSREASSAASSDVFSGSSSSSSGEEEQDKPAEPVRERPVSRSKSEGFAALLARENNTRSPFRRSETDLTKTAGSTTTASGKMKRYSNVQSRVDARLRRSASDAKSQLADSAASVRLKPRLTMPFGDPRPIVGAPPATDDAHWYPGATLGRESYRNSACVATEDKLQSEPVSWSAERLQTLMNQDAAVAATGQAVEQPAPRRVRPMSADAVGVDVSPHSTRSWLRHDTGLSAVGAGVLRTPADLSAARKVSTPPERTSRRTASPAISEPNSPTTAPMGEIISANAAIVAKPDSQKKQQKQTQDNELHLTELLLKQRWASGSSDRKGPQRQTSPELQAAQAKLSAFSKERHLLLVAMQDGHTPQPQQPQHMQRPSAADLLSAPTRHKQKPISGSVSSPGLVSGGSGVGMMGTAAQRNERTRQTQEFAVREQQQEEMRKKQRDKVWKSSLPKASRHASRRSGMAAGGVAGGRGVSGQQKHNFRAAQAWSGTMLAW